MSACYDLTSSDFALGPRRELNCNGEQPLQSRHSSGNSAPSLRNVDLVTKEIKTAKGIEGIEKK